MIMMKNNRPFLPLIACDYDCTLVLEDKWPDVGTPNMVAIKILKEYKRRGGQIILWTCREGQSKINAVNQMKELGLTFDAVNNDTPEAKRNWLRKNPGASFSNKAFACLYIDDRNPEAVYNGGINWDHICEILLGCSLEEFESIEKQTIEEIAS